MCLLWQVLTASDRPVQVVLIHGGFAEHLFQVWSLGDSDPAATTQPAVNDAESPLWNEATLLKQQGPNDRTNTDGITSSQTMREKGSNCLSLTTDQAIAFFGRCNGEIEAFCTNTWLPLGQLRYPFHVSKWDYVDARVQRLAVARPRVPGAGDCSGLQLIATYERHNGVCFDLDAEHVPERSPSEQSEDILDPGAYSYAFMHETDSCDRVKSWEMLSYQFVIVPTRVAPCWDDASYACNWVGDHGFSRHMESCYEYEPQGEDCSL